MAENLAIVLYQVVEYGPVFPPPGLSMDEYWRMVGYQKSIQRETEMLVSAEAGATNLKECLAYEVKRLNTVTGRWREQKKYVEQLENRLKADKRERSVIEQKMRSTRARKQPCQGN